MTGNEATTALIRALNAAGIPYMIAVKANRIDWDFVNQWCDLHGT